MADVSGKGLKAAVQTAMLKYTLRGFALENPGCARSGDLARVNDVLCSPMSSHEGFRYPLLRRPQHPHGGALIYANAGHEPPLQRDAATGAVQELGRLATVWPWARSPMSPTTRMHRFALAPGDLLLLYTDGLTEARAPTARSSEPTA